MSNIIKKLSIALTLIWLTGCAQTTVRHHQDFQEVAKTIDSVVILPADVEVELINFNGDNEILEEKSAAIKAEINALAAARLADENLNVITFDFKTEIENNEEFAYAVTQAKEAWNKAKEDLYKNGLVSEKEKANFQTSLGSVLNTIAETTGADAALLMHYNAYEKSEGMIAKDVASSVLVGVLTLGTVIPIQATQGSFVDVALVDTSTGKVIWANRKAGAAADSGATKVVFDELPDLTWKSELTNELQVSESKAASEKEAMPAEEVSSGAK